MNRLCELCGKRLAEHKHHALSDTRMNRILYGKLLDNPLNVYYLCSVCHLGKSIPKDSELLFCMKLKIKPRSKSLLSKINSKKIISFWEE